MNKIYWKLTYDEYEFIKGEVGHIFSKYKIKCIPVSGFEIATKMGITLMPYSGLSKEKCNKALEVSEDGFFLENNGKEYVFYNNINCSYERQNWTILHELGHIVLDHTGHGQHEEDEANFFAKYAIAPPILICKIGAKTARDIYDAFDVSREVAAHSFSYYCNWKKKYAQKKRLEDYEKKILALYRQSA